jgi:hypothetical protein
MKIISIINNLQNEYKKKIENLVAQKFGSLEFKILRNKIAVCFQPSIGAFCLFVATISNEKKRKNGIQGSMLCFNNNTFFESNEKVQRVRQITIRKSMPCFANNVFFSKINSTSPPNINVGPFFPFHSLHYLFPHSSQVVPRV